MTDKITKITRVHIPKHHRKWAGLEEEEEEPEEDKKKNDLDTKKLDKFIQRAYDHKVKTYDKKGNIVEYSETIDKVDQNERETKS